MQTVNARLIETEDGPKVIDEYGDVWDYVADDLCGNYAVEGVGGAAIFVKDSRVYASGMLLLAKDGTTFDLNVPSELVVIEGTWRENPCYG